MVPPFIRCLLVIDLLLAVLYLGTRFWPVPSSFVMLNLDLDSERTMTAWYASAKWLVAAQISWFAMSALRTSTNKWKQLSGLLLPLTLVFLSLDETAGVHEEIGVLMDRFVINRSDTMFSRTNYWMVPCGLVLLAVVTAVFRSLRDYSSKASFLTAGGLGLLVLGGGAIEALQNFVVAGSSTHWLQISLEETLENLGGTVVILAMIKLDLAINSST
jgi:hypothetical protein